MDLLGKCTQIRTHTQNRYIPYILYLCYDDPKVDRICFHPKNHFSFVMILQNPYHICSRMTLPLSLSICIGRKLKIRHPIMAEVLLYVLHTRPMVACCMAGSTSGIIPGRSLERLWPQPRWSKRWSSVDPVIPVIPVESSSPRGGPRCLTIFAC